MSNPSHEFVWMPSLKVWIYSPSWSQSIVTEMQRSKLKTSTNSLTDQPQKKRQKCENFRQELSSGCPVCLGDVDKSQVAVLSLCMHQFCLTCIQKWSTLQRKCPLCKRIFDGWFYDIQDNGTYRENRLLPLSDKTQASIDGNRDGHMREIDYQRALHHARGQILGNRRSTRPLPRRRNFGHSRFVSSAERRRIEEESAAERALRWRASIYQKGLRAIPPRLQKKIYVRQKRTYNLTDKARIERRMEPWIRRELEAILGDQDPTILIHLVFSLWFSTLREPVEKQKMDLICSENEYIRQLEPFLGCKASLFWHELRCFAESPFTMNAYDSVVEY